MLPRDDGGVVDHQLKVYGTKNLRIVDLSIVPLHFASHSQGNSGGTPHLVFTC
jgi:choline dehydrogenase-like flavoprotein